MKDILLASGSAIRRQLLEAAGVGFAVRPASIDEAALQREMTAKGLEAGDLALELAKAKALSGAAAAPEAVVIGADQVLLFEDAPLSKASSLAEAAERLWSMRGAEHALVGGVALARGDDILWSTRSVVRVRLRAFSRAFLDAYLAAVGEPVLASVCCYEIEGRGAQLIESIDGDYFSALGLPLLPLLKALRSEGALPA